MRKKTIIKAMSFDPKSISPHKKRRFLLSLSISDFQHQIVRPLFHARCFHEIDYASHENVLAFVIRDTIGIPNVYLVALFKGSVAAHSGAKSIDEVVQQMSSLKSERLRFSETNERRAAAKLLICCTGKINDTARRRIIERVQDPRLDFLDADDLTPQIDELLPAVWLGIDPEVMPYLRNLSASLRESNEELTVSEFSPGSAVASVVSDDMFVPLKLYRVGMKLQRKEGHVTRAPDFEQIPATGVLSQTTKKLLILGEAGSGKSTILRRFAYILAQEGLRSPVSAKLPILVRASDIYAQTGISIKDILNEQIKSVAQTESAGIDSNSFGAANLILLVDALDEVPTDEERARVLSKINQFCFDHHNTRVIITSRTFAFVKRLPELEDYREYHISPLDFKQTEQIITRLQKKRSLPSERSKELLRRLQQVHGIELNPLLVTVFAATTEYSRQDIPANITELFKKYTEIMLGRWDASKGLAHQYHAPLKDFLLKKVAYRMHLGRKNHISEEEFRNCINSELKERGHETDSEELMEEILYRSGLFRIVGSTVEFRHLLLQEFFAGRGIPSMALLREYVADEWWQRAVVFYFGENPSDAEGLTTLMAALHDAPPETLFQTALTLGIALQACYLVPVEEKAMVLTSIIGSLAKVETAFIDTLGEFKKYRLNSFLIYYVFGRDAVACGILRERWRQIWQDLNANTTDQSESDLKTFWVIVGLLEIGAVLEAAELCQTFNPTDPRLLFGLYIGCAMILQLRVHSDDERRDARRLFNQLAIRIDPLRDLLFKEMKSSLLELREGKIELIEG